MQLTSEQVEKAEPISAHPDKIKDQIADNKVRLKLLFDMADTVHLSVTACDLSPISMSIE